LWMMKKIRPTEWTIFPRKQYDEYRVGIVYPSSYYVGMSNLGFHWVLHQIEQTEGFACERFFMPPETGALPVSLENKMPASECHILVFSISFESDYLSVMRFLLASSIPPETRRRDKRYPLIVAGGAALQVNPEVLAPFIDLMLMGEGEAVLAGFLDAYQDARDRYELIDQLAGQPYIYAPSKVEVDYDDLGGITRLKWKGEGAPDRLADYKIRFPAVSAESLAQHDPPFNNILSDETEFPRTLLVEIARGCPMGCRYCWAGFRYLPMRPFDAERILDLARRARSVTDRIGLISTAVCQHPRLLHILRRVQGMGYSIGVSSLRLSDISEELLSFLVAGGKESITLAPETGSLDLRRKINKYFTNDEILDKCRMVFAAGIRRIKLYFLVGLPWETKEDLIHSVSLVREIQKVLREAQKAWETPGKITVSINPFVPKPNTPFQHVPMDSMTDLKKKIRFLSRQLHDLDGVDIQSGSAKEAFFQYRLSTGTRRTGEALLALAERRMSLSDFLIGNDGWKGWDQENTMPPWSVVDWGLSQEFLNEEMNRAREGRLTTPCPGNSGCSRCGICIKEENQAPAQKEDGHTR